MASTLLQEPQAPSLISEPSLTWHTIGDALRLAEDAYVSRHPVSKALHAKALRFMPGGNTRSVLHSDPFPVCLKKGEMNRLWDHDGNKYIDFVGELTAGLYGHSHPKMRETILETFDNVGMNLGGTTREETQLAELICERFPHIQQLRFCNSGTEANIYALSIARHITGRRKVIAFGGGYHGGVLSFGHGIAENNVDKDDWVLGKFNDAASAKALIESTTEGAAVIVEAMQGAGGCVPATTEFLHAIRDAAKKTGKIFILDEVMTSRLHPSGLAGKLELSPDLTTLGKYLGGGIAFGAFGGSEHLLSSYDPRVIGSLPHSGTFNNNTLSMRLGYVGLAELYTPSANIALNSFGDYFRSELQAIAQGTQMVVVGVGAVLTIHFLKNGTAPASAEDIDHNNIPDLKRLFWFWCLERGYWITERGMLSIILGTTKSEINSYLCVVRDFVKVYANLIAL
ncbi:glutamate-1-semialdehyde 2,1-aminomutase [Phlyctema vagabunda]|uniref:Glutamate-1-semialdehyde 2,1-aminomutase n=1 Tax=Phlyctema vagabunda TaxID=108571 RepID=A0ABR4PV11_9HELO